MRILDKERAVVLDLDRHGRALGENVPGIAAVLRHDIFADVPVHILRFKISVFEQFGIQSAVQPVIDVLKKDARTARVYGDAVFF